MENLSLDTNHGLKRGFHISTHVQPMFNPKPFGLKSLISLHFQYTYPKTSQISQNLVLPKNQSSRDFLRLSQFHIFHGSHHFGHLERNRDLVEVLLGKVSRAAGEAASLEEGGR